MSPMRLIILVGAALAAIAAAFLVRNMSSQGPAVAPVAQTETIVETREVSETKVLVARRDLRVGDMVSEADMEWAPWPEQNVVRGYATEEDNPEALEQYVGSIVRVPIYDREPMLAQKLVLKSDTGTMAALLSPGMRAISVEISTESASGGFILPNDRVDVILTHEVEVQTSDSVTERTATETILQNVRVLAIDQIFNKEEDDETASVIGNTATLEVTAREAELIALGQRMGTLSLSLRPWSDVSEAEPRGARTDLLDGGFGSGGSVTIYRNGKMSGVGGI